jgi:hypothetical protein
VPQDNFAGPASSLCSLGPGRPQIVTGFFVELLRLHFADPASIENPLLQAHPWTNNPTTTGILIEDATVWKPELAGFRSAIVVKRGRWQFQSRAVNNQSAVTFEGHVEYSVPLIGSHTFYCLGREGAELELLATEVWKYLLHFQPVIRQTLQLLRFNVLDVGELGILAEATDRYAIPVPVAYSLMETWVLKEHSPLLKRVIFGRSIYPY